MGLPLICVDPDDHCSFNFAVMFCVLSIFLTTAIVSAATMAWKNAAGSGEQGDNAY